MLGLKVCLRKGLICEKCVKKIEKAGRKKGHWESLKNNDNTAKNTLHLKSEFEGSQQCFTNTH